MGLFDRRARPAREDTAPKAAAPALRTSQVKALYERPPSFTDFLPWVEYLPDSGSFLLEDVRRTRPAGGRGGGVGRG